MDGTLVLAVLSASLLGSPHCAGMCGGFACFYAGAGARPGAGSGWLPHAAYNLGRLASYALLGALAGALGAGVNEAAHLAGLARGAAVVAGVLMVAWGGSRLAAAWGVRLPGPGGAGTLAVQRRLGALLRRAQRHPPAVRAGALGLLTTLLPCGWLYAFVVTAAGTGHPARGALVMTAFWLGTLPVMVGVGLGAQRMFGPLRQRLPLVSAAALVVIGLLSIGGKLAAPHDAGTHRHAAAPAARAHSHAHSHAPSAVSP